MFIKQCKNKGSYIVQKNIKLDFQKLKKYKKIASTSVVIILKDKYEVTCYKNGKLKIKNCPNKEEARTQADKIYKLFK